MKNIEIEFFYEQYRITWNWFALPILCALELQIYFDQRFESMLVDGLAVANKLRCVCCPFDWADSIENGAANFQATCIHMPTKPFHFSGSHRRVYSLDFQEYRVWSGWIANMRTSWRNNDTYTLYDRSRVAATDGCIVRTQAICVCSIIAYSFYPNWNGTPHRTIIVWWMCDVDACAVCTQEIVFTAAAAATIYFSPSLSKCTVFFVPFLPYENTPPLLSQAHFSHCPVFARTQMYFSIGSCALTYFRWISHIDSLLLLLWQPIVVRLNLSISLTVYQSLAAAASAATEKILLSQFRYFLMCFVCYSV